MKYDDKQTFSGRFTDSIRDKFNEVDAKFPNITTTQLVEQIILELDEAQHAAVSEPDTNLLAEIQDLQSKIAEKDKIIAELQSVDNSEYEQVIDDLRKVNEDLSTENESLKDENQQLVNERNELSKKLMQIDILKTNPEKGVYTVALPPMADELMQVTVNRLREKLKSTDLTAEKLLIDLFVKYTAKRPADFAYPFVISKDEFNVILAKHKKN